MFQQFVVEGYAVLIGIVYLDVALHGVKSHVLVDGRLLQLPASFCKQGLDKP